MLQDTFEFLDSGISKLLTVYNGNINDARYDEPAYPDHQELPYALYVIYIGITKFGQLDVKHYLHKGGAAIPQAHVPGLVKGIAERARRDDLGPQVDIGVPGLQKFGLHGIVWRHKSHVALMVDSRHWELFNGTKGPAIVFNTSKGSTSNHTFFDAKTTKIQLDPNQDDQHDDGNRWAIYFINHMKKNDYGDDLGYRPDGTPRTEIEKFIFDIYFEVTGMDGNKTVVIVDPDGGNEGPPIGPP